MVRLLRTASRLRGHVVQQAHGGRADHLPLALGAEPEHWEMPGLCGASSPAPGDGEGCDHKVLRHAFRNLRLVHEVIVGHELLDKVLHGGTCLITLVCRRPLQKHAEPNKRKCCHTNAALTKRSKRRTQFECPFEYH